MSGIYPLTTSPFKVRKRNVISSDDTLPTIDLATLYAGATGSWYEFTDPATVFSDFAGTIPAVQNDPIGLLLDKSPNAVHVGLLAPSSARPVFSSNGGATCATFNAANLQRLSAGPAGGILFGSAFGCLLAGVVIQTAGLPERCILSADFSPGTREFALSITQTTPGLTYMFGAGNQIQSAVGNAADISVGPKYLVVFWLVNQNWVCRINKVQTAAGALGFAMGAKGSDRVLGAFSAASNQLAMQSWFNGTIFNCMCLSRAASAITLAEVVQVENYLAAIANMGI